MNSSSGEGPYLADMEVAKLKLLKKLIDDSGSIGIVLTSDRRYSKIYMDKFIDVLDQFEIFMLGELREPQEDDDRGRQIKDYLDSIDENIDKIVILDDNDENISTFFKEEFIEVNKYYGLNDDVYSRAIKILN